MAKSVKGKDLEEADEAKEVQRHRKTNELSNGRRGEPGGGGGTELSTSRLSANSSGLSVNKHGAESHGKLKRLRVLQRMGEIEGSTAILEVQCKRFEFRDQKSESGKDGVMEVRIGGGLNGSRGARRARKKQKPYT